MTTTVQQPAQQLVLPDVDWKTYGRLLRAFSRRPAVRLTYDRGVLEIMTITHEHESYNYLLARLIDALTEELGLAVKGGRSTTFRRRQGKRGLEPDSSWWIAHEPEVRGKLKIDLRVDPPPDLALEIDVTHSSLDRLRIYAALKVPEVWRFDGQTLTFYVLDHGAYQANVESRSFPGVKPDDFGPFLLLRDQVDENTIVRRFREHVQKQLGRQR